MTASANRATTFPAAPAAPAAPGIPARAPRPRSRFGLFALAGLFRQRAALRNMTDAQLRDIGITREQAATEARRPLWDVPAHWLR